MRKPYSQARIRINREGGLELVEALEAHVGFLLDVREAVPGATDARRDLNRRIEATRRVIMEALRSIEEQGWSQEASDEHQQPHPA